jgi:hypothetical protein
MAKRSSQVSPGILLLAARAAIAVACLALTVQAAFAVQNPDCYRIVLKHKLTGVVSDMGCPALDCDPGPDTVNCVERQFLMAVGDPPVFRDCKDCICAGDPQTCTLVVYTVGTTVHTTCRSNNCQPPKQCAQTGTGWAAYSSTHDRATDCRCP